MLPNYLTCWYWEADSRLSSLYVTREIQPDAFLVTYLQTYRKCLPRHPLNAAPRHSLNASHPSSLKRAALSGIFAYNGSVIIAFLSVSCWRSSSVKSSLLSKNIFQFYASGTNWNNYWHYNAVSKSRVESEFIRLKKTAADSENVDVDVDVES